MATLFQKTQPFFIRGNSLPTINQWERHSGCKHNTWTACAEGPPSLSSKKKKYSLPLWLFSSWLVDEKQEQWAVEAKMILVIVTAPGRYPGSSE
jgi:hypothetical protein